MTPGFWKDKTVLLTGHTGFKGSWLTMWLKKLGANVVGYSIDIPTQPSLYEVAEVSNDILAVTGDVRDLASLRKLLVQTEPDIIVHMAAQSLVRHSYENPVDTYETNIMGTVNVLEAVRSAHSTKVVIIVTTDKCYHNEERSRGYKEGEPMGGFDPYSSSKGCAELITSSYRNSYFSPDAPNGHSAMVASVRAGNVIGGGEWAKDRLVPDIFRSLGSGGKPVVRHPEAVRPWQFVLDPLHGYLILAEALWKDGSNFNSAWNFGPEASDAKTVGFIADQLAMNWGLECGFEHEKTRPWHEATYLKLDISKAKSQLNWQPLMNIESTLTWITDWYQAFSDKSDMRAFTLDQIDRFQLKAER